MEVDEGGRSGVEEGELCEKGRRVNREEGSRTRKMQESLTAGGSFQAKDGRRLRRVFN